MRSSSQRTALLHCTRSLASWSASSIFKSRRWQSSFMLSSHLFFGLPAGLLPWTLPYSMMFGMHEGCMRATCPKYESLLARTWFTTSLVTPSSNLMSAFLRRSLRATLAIQRRADILNTSNFRFNFLSSSMSLRCTTGPAVQVYCKAWSSWQLQ